MAGGANQYSNMAGMQDAQQFAGKNNWGQAQKAWEGGGGEWTNETRDALQQLGGIDSGRLQQALRFGQGGMMGRAADQITQGSGQWGSGYTGRDGVVQENGVGGLLRGYLDTNPATADLGSFNYDDISESDLAQAQRFANAGMMGRAKGMFGDAWTGAKGRRYNTQLQADAVRNPYKKGTSMGFDWGSIGDKRLQQAKAFALQGKMGKAHNIFIGGSKGKSQADLAGEATGEWSPRMLHQMKAWQKGNA
tara:strand:- start:312 stop:1058 length:747 start_codon:yes stop_codon:yes gene_type:complete